MKKVEGERIVLIYEHYFLDKVDEKTDFLAEEGINTVYHLHEDDAEVFIKENGPFTKILFTGVISEEHEKLFSNPPFNGKKMSS